MDEASAFKQGLTRRPLQCKERAHVLGATLRGQSHVFVEYPRSTTDVDLVALTVTVVGRLVDRALTRQGFPEGGPIVEAVLRDLLQIQDRQGETLHRIDRNVQLLIDAPWNHARLLIEEASLPSRSIESKRQALVLAAADLRKAIVQQQPRTFASAYVCLDLALVDRLIGDREGSAFYARRAFAAADGFVRDVTAGKVRPPMYHEGLKSVLRHGAFGLFGAVISLPVNPSAIGEAVRMGPERLAQLDKDCNTWLAEVFSEFDSVSNAVQLLGGAGQHQVVDLVTPFNPLIVYRHGRIQSRTQS